MIFEATEPGFPADQAVRIFVQFERVEAATKVGMLNRGDRAVWVGLAKVGWLGSASRCVAASCIEPHLASNPPAATPCMVPAPQALVDLQGRFFGGREVSASFFEEERFERRELAPRPEEVRR
jgi:hypothetical protein